MRVRDPDQPLRRLFLAPRPLTGVIGWLGAFLFLFIIFGTGRGQRGAADGQGAVGARPAGTAAEKVRNATLLPSEPPAPDLSPRVVTIGLWQKPAGLWNPLFATDPGDREINAFLFEPLLTVGPDLRPAPNLASYAVEPDQKAIVFTLRHDARWQDGAPVTASDVAFTLETALRGDYHGPYADRFLFIRGARAFHDGKAGSVAGIAVRGPLQVRVELERPYGPALQAIGSLPVLPAHVFAGQTPAEMANAPASRAYPVGSGPFRLVGVRQAPGPLERGGGREAGPDEVRLAAFPGFFRGRPRLDELRFRVLGPRLNAAELAAEGIDLLRVRREDAEAVRQAGYDLREWPERGYRYLGINMGRAALQDRRVRQAIAFALDRQAMLRAVYGGHGTLMLAPVFPGSWAEAPGLNPYPHDAERARRLLEEAGWRDVDGDGVRERGGARLSLSLLYRKGEAVDERLAALARDELAQVGIEVRPQALPERELFRQVFGLRDFDLYLSGWNLTIDPDVSDLFGSGARVNAVGYRQGNDLLGRAASFVDVAQRQPLYHQWTRQVNDDLPYIFLFTPNQVLAVAHRLKGVEVTALGYAHGAEGWWVAP